MLIICDLMVAIEEAGLLQVLAVEVAGQVADWLASYIDFEFMVTGRMEVGFLRF